MDSNNKNILIVLAGGFVVALLVAIVVQAALGGGDKKETLDSDYVEILVAAKDLPVGRDLKEGDLKWQPWPASTVFSGAIIREEDISAIDAAGERKLLRGLAEAQPVHENLLTQTNKGNFLSVNIEKGKRAVGISVRSHVLADRLIRPGDYVDILMTYQLRTDPRQNPDAANVINRYASETVIENVRVLAVDKEDTKAVDEAEEDKKGKSAKSGSKATLTVEVDPKQAEYLLLADRMGEIGLALRSHGDRAPIATNKMSTDVKVSNVLTQLSEMRESSSAVRVYNGDQLVEFQARGSNTNINMGYEIEEQDNEDNQSNNDQPTEASGVANDTE